MAKRSNNIRVFSPEPIIFQDDARHRTGYFSHVETWYYDAVFENGYSIVSLVNIIHIGNIGTVLSGIFIYKDGNLIKKIRTRYPLKNCYGSEETLLLKINHKEIIKGTIESDERWTYRIHRGDEENGFDLHFIKTMKPFKGKTFLGKWLVIPGFSVTGTLFVDGKKMHVSGMGYHDHNMYPLKAPFVTKGYFFGKIPLADAKVIWAQVTKNKHNKETLVLLAKKDSFVSIHPDHITFQIIEEKKVHRKKMPQTCNLIVNDPQLNLDVEFTSQTYHHIGILAAHYYRYHEKYIGTYQLNGETNRIDLIDVAEYLTFF